MDPLWARMAKNIDWTCEPIALAERFVKLISNKNFSTREAKRLRKIIRRKRADPNFGMTTVDIIKEFPGKTAKTVEDFAKEKGWLKKENELKPETRLLTQHYKL